MIGTGEELENAGASAITSEDTALPLDFGVTTGEEQLISLEEGTGKIKAAAEARQDKTTVIVARTNALRVGGLPETIRRAKAYETAGADALFLPVSYALSPEELGAVHAEVKMPLIRGHLYSGEIKEEKTLQLADKKFLAANGVKIASAGPLTVWSSVQAVYETLKGLADGGSPDNFQPKMASHQLRGQVTRQDQYKEWIKRYLT